MFCVCLMPFSFFFICFCILFPESTDYMMLIVSSAKYHLLYIFEANCTFFKLKHSLSVHINIIYTGIKSFDIQHTEVHSADHLGYKAITNSKCIYI